MRPILISAFSANELRRWCFSELTEFLSSEMTGSRRDDFHINQQWNMQKYHDGPTDMKPHSQSLFIVMLVQKE